MVLGTFSVKMAEISGEMVKEKVHHIMDVHPDYLIGADVSCLLNRWSFREKVVQLK